MSVDRAAGPASRVAALAGAFVLLSLVVASQAPASSDETAPPDSTGWEEPLGSDSLDLPAAADSVPPFTILPAPPESGDGRLPTSPLDFRNAFPDTSAPGAVADTTAVPEAAATESPAPFAVAFRLKPEPGGEFARPWSAWDAGRAGGLRVVAAPVPGALASSAPFKREFSVDLDREWVSVETRSTGGLAFLLYAAPLAQYLDAEAERQASDAWKRMFLADLGKESAQAAGSILDIDIPMPLPGPFVRAIGPGANLKVRGSERITFGGQTSYVVDALQQETAPPSKFPQLDMQQQLTVNLEGTIGRKIHVYVDHRSGGEDLGVGKANQIRVHYDGDEDEIIQKIELGEVNLSLPGTEFVSYSGGQEGLFGAKMSAKIGKLDLVSIASKEEGKSAGASFTGTSESDSLVLNDIGYEPRTFFAVDSDALKYSNVGLQQLRVYVDDRDGSNDIETGASPGVAYLADPVNPSAPPSGPRQRGMFDQLVELEDYLVDYQTGIVQFTPQIAADDVLAVSYARVDGYSVGGSGGDSLRLKMIKKEDRVAGTEWQRTRLYELKNVYNLGAEGIPQEGFQLVIRKRTPSGEILDNQNGKPFIQILGLDTHDLSGVNVPDGLVDLEWIDFEKGYLSFPHFTPFCPAYDETTNFYYVAGDTAHYRGFARALDPKNCVVYSEETFDPADDIYFLEVKYNRPKTTFYLGQINIIENSEVVRLNGVKLTRGADYTIYYPAGQLTLLAEEAKEPDAKVTVDFDYQPFGIGGEKTLLGARGVFNWNENIQLGTTWMYQSKGTPEERPRLGEEPSRTMLGDVNLSAKFKPELLTRIADAIPLVDTDAPSRLELDAEAAVCIPEPNTKGFVSVDDMEGTKNVSMLGVTRRLWVPSSVPVDPTGLPAVAAAERMDIRWYNPDRLVREGDLFPYLPEQEFNDIHTVLALRDYFSDGTWAGLMRLLSKTGVDYSDYEFVEFWVDAGAAPTGTVHVELGTVSEDFYPLRAPNGTLNSEDVDRNGFDADEDTGLDNCCDTPGCGGAQSGCVPDPDDDYLYEYGSEDYTHINGTEDNDKLDTEDLNGNWYLDTENRYWSLTVELGDDTYLIQDNSTYPDPAKRTNWRLYRIPLSDAASVGGMSDWRSVKSARIWTEGVPLAEAVLLGSLDVVGNQWEAGPIRDLEDHIVPGPELAGAAFRVASKNTKEDLDYVPPFDPGVDQDTNLPKREQSLALLYENLGSGQSGAATRVSYSDENYTDYQSLELYVHGEADVEAGTTFFIRLGADTLNYYEYSFEVRPGWLQKAGAARNRLSMPFSGFSDLKLDPYAGMDTVVVWGDTTLMKREAFKRVGWPSLSRVRRLTVGVRNGDTWDPLSRITGEIWVDDLRLADVHKEVGWAQRATVQASLADLVDGSFDLRHMDGDFHTLKQTRGSGQDNITYNATATLNADRFVSGLGVSLPVNTTWKRSVTRPKFSTGSDVVLDAEQSEKEKTETLERSLSVALARKRQSPDFWTHLLADGLSLRASIGDQQRISPTKADTSQTIRGRISYKYSPEKAGIRIFRDTYFFLKPTDLRFSADTYLTHASNYDIASTGVKTLRTDRYDKKLDAEVNVDFEFLDNLKTAHAVSAKRDLAQINRTLADVNIGVETERRYTNTLSFSPKFGSWLSPEYSFSSSFNDNHGPDVRRQGDPPGVRDIRVQSDQDLRASFDMKKIFGLSQPRRAAPRPQPGAQEARAEGRPAQEASPRAPDENEEAGEGEEPAQQQGQTGAEVEPQAPQGAEPGVGTTTGEKEEGEGGKAGPAPAEGPGLEVLFEPVLAFFRGMDAIEGGYGLQRTSKYDRVTADEVPGWAYRLGLTRGVGSDDRTEEHVLTLGTGAKVTESIRVKGDYRRRMSGRWYRSAVADTIRITSRSESMDESTKGTLSWSGLERIGLLSGRLSSMRARSGVEYKRSYSGPYGDPTSRGRGFALSPIVSVDATFKNGLTGSLSWDRKRSLGYSLSGAGSVTEDVTGSTSATLNYRFSAPQGLKLPFFGEKLKFQSNLDCSLTLKTSSKTSRTAPSEGVLPNVDPTASVRDLSVIGDATYSFSRSVSGGLQVSFSQSRDEKRDQTRRTIGVHLTAEFKF